MMKKNGNILSDFPPHPLPYRLLVYQFSRGFGSYSVTNHKQKIHQQTAF